MNCPAFRLIELSCTELHLLERTNENVALLLNVVVVHITLYLNIYVVFSISFCLSFLFTFCFGSMWYVHCTISKLDSLLLIYENIFLLRCQNDDKFYHFMCVRLFYHLFIRIILLLHILIVDVCKRAYAYACVLFCFARFIYIFKYNIMITHVERTVYNKMIGIVTTTRFN